MPQTTIRNLTESTNDAVQLGYFANSVTIDNYSQSFLYVPAANRYIPPYTVSAVIQFPSGTQEANLQWSTPAGIIVPAVGQPLGSAYAVWTDAILAASSGLAAYTPASTPSNTSGTVNVSQGLAAAASFQIEATFAGGIVSILTPGILRPNIVGANLSLWQMRFTISAAPAAVQLIYLEYLNTSSVWTFLDEYDISASHASTQFSSQFGGSTFSLKYASNTSCIRLRSANANSVTIAGSLQYQLQILQSGLG